MTASPQVIAVLAILHSRHGRGLIAESDVRSAIDVLPNAPRLSAAEHDFVLGEIQLWIENSVLRESVDALIGFDIDDSMSLTPEEDAQLVELLRSRSPIAREDLNAVTRRFLEEVLAGADIPDELLEAIVEAYVKRGTLAMDEHGGRYTISL